MALSRKGFSQRAIAKASGLSQSTISRELRRHFEDDIPLAERILAYDAHMAQANYSKHRKTCKPHGKFTAETASIVEKYIRKGYSAEQVSHTILPTVSFVTLYAWLTKGLLFYGDKTVLRHV